MQEIKEAIAKNIQQLRRSHKMTQNELALKINYTDKAVSKWERAESVPDIVALKQIADTFSVTVDYLITKEHKEYKKRKKEKHKIQRNNRKIITLISIVLVWLVALFVYMSTALFARNEANWLAFVYAVPVSAVVGLTFNSIWGKPRFNYFIISIIMWSILTSVFLTIVIFAKEVIWLLFVLGVPAQIIIILWSRLKSKHQSGC